ncbi:uncharacterized protein [Leptinotarsa decemlineata]|uniref:uncharacterized protein n=1 Tax=Leptinotarsa decemlineata TaxID=7539 RepID=UPI003D30989C
MVKLSHRIDFVLLDISIRHRQLSIVCGSTAGAARKRVPHYIYEEQLRFLKKNREMRPTESTIEDDNDGSTEDHDELNIILNANENAETAEETSLEHTATSESQTPSAINRKRKKTNIEDKLSQFIDTTLKKQTENDRKEPDEDGAFFTSLIPAVRLLTNDEKIQFRIEVSQLLQRFKNNSTTYTGTHGTMQYMNPPSFQCGHACSYPNYPDNNLAPLGPSSSSAGSYLSQFSPDGDSAQY